MSNLDAEDEKLNRDIIEGEQVVEANESQPLGDVEQVSEVEKPSVFSCWYYKVCHHVCGDARNVSAVLVL